MAATATALNSLLGSSETQAVASAVKKTMGKEDFLKLLTTQLRYQDPLSPEDPKDFVAQLAQFSALEQQLNTNTNLTNLATIVQNLKNSQDMAQGVGLLGKTVKGTGNTISVTGGQALGGGFELPQAAQEVTVSLYNSGGALVRTLNLGAQPAGYRSFVWDARDSSGKAVADGIYTYQVSAADKNGKSLSATNYFTGQVAEVLQDSQGVWLVVNGRRVLLGNITAVLDGS